MFNYVLDHATVPSQWKLGEISPVHKDCNLMKSNYWPISILPWLSKAFERLIHNRVGPYFEDLYRKLVRMGHGYDTALLSLTEQCRKELDNQKIIGLESMDFSKACDMLFKRLQEMCKTCRHVFPWVTRQERNSPGINPEASIVQHIYEWPSSYHWFYFTVHLCRWYINRCWRQCDKYRTSDKFGLR